MVACSHISPTLTHRGSDVTTIKATLITAINLSELLDRRCIINVDTASCLSGSEAPPPADHTSSQQI